jgi:hypothetical protein
MRSPASLLKLGATSQASVLGGDLHLDEAVYGFALLFNVGSTHQQGSIFEEGMLVHQGFDA